MSRPQFILVGGPNGAGKSTLSNSIRKRVPNVQVIDPDVIAKDLTGSFATVDQVQLTAGKKALDLVKNYVNQGQPFLIESTISGSTYPKYAAQAKLKGFRTTFIYVALRSAELSYQRVSKRVALGGHPIPFDDIRRRFPRSLNNLGSHIKAFESAHILDNSDHYQWLCDYRNGVLHKVSPQLPVWIKQYLP